MFSKLEKVTIEAYKDVERTSPATPDKIELMFNPTSYQEQHGLSYQKIHNQPINSPGSSLRYAYTPPADIAFKFILDGTGVDRMGINQIFGSSKSVDEQIADFKQLGLEMNGDTHQPNYLTLRWGKEFAFPCRLKTLNITYKLFDRSGDAMRAELDVVFARDESQEVINRRAGKSSPDLTHVHTVKSGDTLPYLCRQLYGSPKHYLFVAKANDLDDFRNLVPGRQLRFPPLQPDAKGGSV